MILTRTIVEEIERQVNPSGESWLAFAHYMRAFHGGEPWRIRFVHEWLGECLLFPHWRQNRILLLKEIREYLMWIQNKMGWDLFLENFPWQASFQVVKVENPEDQQLLINKFVSKVYPAETYRVRIQSGVHRPWVVQILHLKTRELTQRLFDDQFLLDEGDLLPLRQNDQLQWGSDLELKENVIHSLELGSFIRHRFIQKKGLFDVVSVRGYLFAPYKEWKNESLLVHPKLFYAIKHYESLFLHKETNPFYVTLVRELERTGLALRRKDAVSMTELTDLLVRAKSSLEIVFPGDKLLSLLLEQLETYSQLSENPLDQVNWSLSGLDFDEDEAQVVSLREMKKLGNPKGLK